ncbi:beta-lactamase family protein [Bacillus sp. BHET2]|nr:beta-lactamase family protein [Bacillus sp. BHET2]
MKEKMHASGAGLVIMKENKIVYEWYSGTHHFEMGARNIDRSSQFNVYSTRVTYVGLAAAIAVFEGCLNLEDKISDYFNELDKEVLGETTVRHLITRCTGLKIKNEQVQRVFDLGTNIEGKRPDLLAKIVKQATGKTVNQILGASGCACLVIPQFNVVAVRMYNSLYTYENKNFDYIQDIQTFGNLVVKEIKLQQ